MKAAFGGAYATGEHGGRVARRRYSHAEKNGLSGGGAHTIVGGNTGADRQRIGSCPPASVYPERARRDVVAMQVA
jgi:hypothetical protein